MKIRYQTRWTFFRVKLVFECDFKISWSLGPWDPWTFGLLDFFLPSTPPLSSSFTSSYLFLLLSSFGIVWYGLVWGGWVLVLTLEIEIDYWRLTFDLYIDVEKLGVWKLTKICGCIRAKQNIELFVPALYYLHIPPP